MLKSYFGIIPASVRYDKELTANAKLLYSELTALTNEKGYCWATNGYFADLYGVSKNSVSNWLKNLSDRGYIKVKYIYQYGTKELKERRIYLNLGQGIEYAGQDEPILGQNDPPQNNLDTPQKNIGDPLQNNLDTPPKNFGDPPQKNLEDNNTFNNTFNNTVNNTPISPQGDNSEGELKTDKNKKSDEPKSKKKTVISVIKDFAGNDEEMVEALKEFNKMRKLMRKPQTPRAMKMNINALKKLSGEREEQIAIINQSIQKSWQSFYALSDDSSFKKKQEELPKRKIGTWL